MTDSDHEAYGAMIHRGLVEEATRGRDYHNEQAKEIERLRAELAAEREKRRADELLEDERLGREIARAQKAEDERAKLREALEPFARLRVGRFMTNGITYSWRIDVAHIRHATTVLAETGALNERD